MRSGDTFVLDLGRMAPDFKTVWTDAETFPMDKITDFELWRRPRHHRSIVKPKEDYDLMGNKKQFRMQDDFTLVFLISYYSDEQVMRAYRNIPNAEQMQLIVVDEIDPTVDERPH